MMSPAFAYRFMPGLIPFIPHRFTYTGGDTCEKSYTHAYRAQEKSSKKKRLLSADRDDVMV